jgi:CheY-like chemotaxis protein
METIAVEVQRVIEDTLGILERSIDRRIRLERRLDVGRAVVIGDPSELQSALLNLCINARDAMHGRGTVQVAVTQQAVQGIVCASCRGVVSGAFVELSVADEGRGISAEVMDRMFEPFFSTKDTGRGTGMGLAIVHGIVHEHGGHILVESTSTGARFRVLFPAAAGTQAVEIAPRRRAAAPASPLKGRVLLVDDEQMVTRFMRELLQGWGLKVTAVTSATDAKQVFTRAPQDFDVLLTDYTMPRMTGLDLAQALRAVRPGLPVIVYSGYTDVIPEADLGAPPVEVVQKPIDQDALLVALTKHL